MPEEKLEGEELSESEKLNACRVADSRVRWGEMTPFIGDKKDEVARAKETFKTLDCSEVL